MKLLVAAVLISISLNALALTGGAYSTNPRYSAILKVRMDFGPGHERESCSGTFISPRVILTSAHCLVNYEHGIELHPVKIDYSTFPKMDLFWDPNTVEVPSVKFIANPAYLKHPRSTSPDDVGVIVFNSPVSKTWMKLADQAPKSGEDVIVAGYGRDKKRDIWSTDFQIGTVQIEGVDSFLKIKAGGPEYAEGDSGGPVLVETQNGLRIAGLGSYVNLFRGKFGLSKDRAVRLDSASPLHAWVLKQLETN